VIGEAVPMRALLGMVVAVALIVLAPVPSARAAFDPNRIVTAVDNDAKTFSCQAGSGEPIRIYKTTASTRFRVAGKRVRLSYIWNKGGLSDLKVGATVTVQFHVSAGDRIADRVAIYPKK
jgi:hypothetical protein